MGFVSATRGVLVIALISLVVLAGMTWKSPTSNLVLLLLRYIHIAWGLFMILYWFLFDQKYDLIYLVMFCVMVSHWFMCNNECILNYLERKQVDPDYKLGEKPYHHGHWLYGLGIQTAQYICFTLVYLRYVGQNVHVKWRGVGYSILMVFVFLYLVVNIRRLTL
jgi:hypothetical protein